jgi:hypothetical protein
MASLAQFPNLSWLGLNLHPIMDISTSLMHAVLSSPSHFKEREDAEDGRGSSFGFAQNDTWVNFNA